MELNLSGPNGQSFDQVLEKIKQGMKAARGGGWIDSDSGSELEITLDPTLTNNHSHHNRHESLSHQNHLNGIRQKQSINSKISEPSEQTHNSFSSVLLSNSNNTPTTRSSSIDHHHHHQNLNQNQHHQHQIQDYPPFNSRPSSLTSSLTTATSVSTTNTNASVHNIPHSTTTITTSIPTCTDSYTKTTLIKPSLNDLTSKKLTITDHGNSPLFGAPTSPYAPGTPLTPLSNGTPSGSPYVRHHFKWEFLTTPTSLDGISQSAQPQPRLIESSSPPQVLQDFESSTDWNPGLPNQTILPHGPHSQSSFHSRLISDFHQSSSSNMTTPLASTTINGLRSVSLSPTQPRWPSTTQSNLAPGSNRIVGNDSQLGNFDSGKPPASFQVSHRDSVPPPPTPLSLSTPTHNLSTSSCQVSLTPSSISSVPFCFAPDASIRSTAPKIGSYLKPATGNKIELLQTSSQLSTFYPSVSTRETGSKTHLSSSTRASSLCLKNLSREKDKEDITAQLMGSTSTESYQASGTHNVNRRIGSLPSLGGKFASTAVTNLPNSFQQLRLSPPNQTEISTTKSQLPSPIGTAPLRSSLNSSYHSSHQYGAPIFYTSSPHGTTNTYSPFSPVPLNSPRHDRSQASHLTPKTPITPIGFNFPNSGYTHQSPSKNISYPPQTVNKPPFVPVIVPVVSGLPGTVGAPLPGQVQPEEVRKSVKTQPPVVNTGNSGAMIPQPGDWMCMCGFVNWRRRKVCMRCFPFADGNDSVGAMMAINAQRAALLAAGVTVPNDYTAPTLPTPNQVGGSFQSSLSPKVEDNNPTGANQATLNRIFAPPQTPSSYGRSLEQIPSRAISQPQQITTNPFDKPTVLGPIKPPSPKMVNQARFASSKPEKLIDAENNQNEVNARREHNLEKVILSNNEQEQFERDDWNVIERSSNRRRSFSMGAKADWSQNDEIAVGSFKDDGKDLADKNLEGSKIEFLEKKECTIMGKGENTGNQRLETVFGCGRIKEVDTTIYNNVATVNRQRTTTSPASSWQAIKALWQ
ncbi:hypothetical protein O181_055233 [Austropuccinia psidii MF-1]|uniref:RanBP2-type domain-containing protein n=1 Tax=Austropuccinia psidii MF-1 TaxID=1389203 RepID=A0A9Q3EAS1_9BASI|nr:hypothetical protein [Austropuccinia psidii MF-1]